VTNSVHSDGNPSAEAQQEYWDERWGVQKSPNGWQQRRADAIIALLKDLPLDDPRILDLGCATGWMTKMLSELGTAEGVDLSEAAIEIAKAKFPGIRYTAGDLYEIELTSEPVDVVVCQEVIAHVSDQSVLIRRIADVMKPGGYLVITAANKFVMDRVRDSDGLVGVGDEDPEDHIKKWLDMKGLKGLIAADFTVLRSTSVIPMGNRGWLRLINSPRLNHLLSWLIPQKRLDALKERMGLGYSIIVLGQKKL
jgi:2-polyprenyl-3-methyl-5-hydroxy-6-metoxy-1,4-benzoquinol methylase